MITREMWEQDKVTPAEERALFDQGAISRCEFEFGPHTDHAECAQMLDTMNGVGVDDGSWERQAYNDELEAASLGRPLFPNEY